MNNSDENMTGFSANLIECESELEAYFYVGTLGGVAGFIKNCVYQDWPLGSLPHLLEMMRLVVERMMEQPPDKPDKSWQHKKGLAEDIRRLIDALSVAAEGAPEAPEGNKRSLYFFELGVYWGVLAAMCNEDMPFLKEAFHSQKCREGVQGRWQNENELYEAAENEAIQYWQTGGKDLHDEVANRLARKYGVEYAALKRRFVRRAHGEGFDTKIRGLPGAKK